MANDNSKERFVRLGSGYHLTETEVKVLQDEALRGSPEPAFRLHLYYELDREDRAESLFWLRIAAENGHPGGQYSLGVRLSEDRDPRNRQRAIFWLERAAANGEELGVDLLNRLKK